MSKLILLDPISHGLFFHTLPSHPLAHVIPEIQPWHGTPAWLLLCFRFLAWCFQVSSLLFGEKCFHKLEAVLDVFCSFSAHLRVVDRLLVVSCRMVMLSLSISEVFVHCFLSCRLSRISRSISCCPSGLALWCWLLLTPYSSAPYE